MDLKIRNSAFDKARALGFSAAAACSPEAFEKGET